MTYKLASLATLFVLAIAMIEFIETATKVRPHVDSCYNRKGICIKPSACDVDHFIDDPNHECFDKRRDFVCCNTSVVKLRDIFSEHKYGKHGSIVPITSNTAGSILLFTILI